MIYLNVWCNLKLLYFILLQRHFHAFVVWRKQYGNLIGQVTLIVLYVFQYGFNYFIDVCSSVCNGSGSSSGSNSPKTMMSSNIAVGLTSYICYICEQLDLLQPWYYSSIFICVNQALKDFYQQLCSSD